MSDVVHHFSDGVYAKEQRLAAGFTVETHAHKYDHLSIMSGGPVLVDCDGDVTEYIGYACITIKAGVKHRIEAKGDSVWFCIHATDETDPTRVDEVLILKGA
jgi:quercetin dioxygenase-like cupin family protein